MASTRNLQRLGSVAERTLRFRFGTWYWGDAIAIDGLLGAGEILGGSYRDGVINDLDRWARVAPISYDDALAPGRAVLELVTEGALAPTAADRIVAALDRLPLADGGIPLLEPQRPQFRFGVCIDALYHLPAMMFLAGVYRGEPEADRRAVQVATAIADLLRCPTGWAQWHDFSLGRNNAIPWSRGLGWAVLGLLDLLALVDHACASSIVDIAGDILETLANDQVKSGHWPAVIGDSEAAEETSTAAFFVAAALHPEAAAVGLPARTKVESAITAVLQAISPDGTYEGVSADVLPTWDLASYQRFPVEPSPWGQGAALRALVALAGADSVKS